jgi:thiamine pyrophosphate-dependent acetolactate synthase large subunit-like protein
MPLLLIGATGPVDAAHRRPWIEWIHTARDQGAIVRGYTKGDDQPASPAAAREAILRAGWLAETNPKGPVYINLDVGLQEAPLTEPLPPCDTRRHRPRVTAGVSAEQIAESPKSGGPKTPVFLIGRVCGARKPEGAHLCRSRRARVITDLKVGAAFPTCTPCMSPNRASTPFRKRARQLSAPMSWSAPIGWILQNARAAFASADPNATIIQFPGSHAAQRWGA